MQKVVGLIPVHNRPVVLALFNKHLVLDMRCLFTFDNTIKNTFLKPNKNLLRESTKTLHITGLLEGNKNCEHLVKCTPNCRE